MKITRLSIVALLFTLVLIPLHDAQAASKKLSAGTYELRVLVTQGEFAGTSLSGKCLVRGSSATYTIDIPFVGKVVAKGTVTKSGSFTIKQVGGSGRATVVVTKAAARSASGRFSKAQSPLAAGTWSMSR